MRKERKTKKPLHKFVDLDFVNRLAFKSGIHALGRNLTVVTNNAREFRRVPGLQVEEWFHS